MPRGEALLLALDSVCHPWVDCCCYKFIFLLVSHSDTLTPDSVITVVYRTPVKVVSAFPLKQKKNITAPHAMQLNAVAGSVRNSEQLLLVVQII